MDKPQNDALLAIVIVLISVALVVFIYNIIYNFVFVMLGGEPHFVLLPFY